MDAIVILAVLASFVFGIVPAIAKKAVQQSQQEDESGSVAPAAPPRPNADHHNWSMPEADMDKWGTPAFDDSISVSVNSEHSALQPLSHTEPSVSLREIRSEVHTAQPDTAAASATRPVTLSVGNLSLDFAGDNAVKAVLYAEILGPRKGGR